MGEIKRVKNFRSFNLHLRVLLHCFLVFPFAFSSLFLYAQNTADGVAAEPGAQTAVATEAPIVAPPKKPEPKFNIWEFEVHGINLIAPETIENVLTPFVGPEKSFSTVEKAAQALEKLYRDSGYPVVVVDIPEQDVVGGKVRLNITEGVISRVKVTGSDYFLLSDIKQRVPSVKEGGALYIPKLQQELNSLNSLSSDLRVVPVLKEGETPGTVDLELKVKDQLPLHGEIEYNNYASANTTATRLSASVGYENLWNKFHNFSLQMQITPEDLNEIKVLSGTYVLPIGGGASRLAVYGVKSDSEINTVTNTASGLQVRGNSKIAGLRYVNPISIGASFQHVVTLGVDYKDVMEEVTFTDDAENKGLLTPMTFALWTGEYKATWRKPEAMTQLGGGIYLGLRGVVNKEEEFSDKRFHGEPNFIYMKASYQRNTNLPADFSLVNKVKLQYTEQPLISNEQISLGGIATVRGYFESQNMGDRGATTTIELFTPKLFKNKKFIADLKLFTFVEGGALEVINPLPDQKNNFELASAGFGMEFSSYEDFKAEVSWAYPLKDACGNICGESAGDVEKGETHTSFNVTYKY
ncbi:MAG: ShlB/FhaC/HecB family hemolysin secretion/activation protein [Pseudomonadota bacterium]